MRPSRPASPPASGRGGGPLVFVSSFCAALAAATPVSARTLEVVQTAELQAAGAGSNDRLGWSLHLFDGGDAALVAARYWNQRRGRVLEFRLVEGSWHQTAVLTPADGAPGDDFGDSIVIDGSRALIGAIQDDANPSGAGKAYVWERGPGGWTETATLDPPDGVSGDYFGFACGLQGDHALVGAARFGHAAPPPGKVYAYVNGPEGWRQTQVLVADDGQPDDAFGGRLAMQGDLAVIGAGHRNDHQGAAYVFQRGPEGWVQQQRLLPADVGPGDYFGLDVALSGERILVSAATADVQGQPSAGAVYVYERQFNVWVKVQTITAFDGPEAGANFGIRLSLDGDRALIGADGVAGATGAAYLYQRLNGGAFAGQQKITAADGGPFQFFGRDVKVHGDRLMVGAMLHPGGGAAYAFDVLPACPADVDGSGTVDVDDLVALILAWGPCRDCPEDLDGSGAVDVDDLVALIGAWGCRG